MINNFTFEQLKKIEKEYGEAFYLLDSGVFEKNYMDLINEFRGIYPKSNIAYSYKTNYIPKLCKIVDKLGGYAEVVSDMEYELAKKIGVKDKDIYFNGPYKRNWAVERLLIDGGIVNVDSIDDWNQIKDIALKNNNSKLNIGLRCNFDINDGTISRFGIDVDSPDFSVFLSELNEIKNVSLVGLHIHFASRSIETWPNRVNGIIDIYNNFFKNYNIKFISLGGGLFGRMPIEMRKQFSSEIPTFNQYAKIAATAFANNFSTYNEINKPELLLEPGTALAGDSMRFVSKVVSIKEVQKKLIATLTGSIYNINPTLNKINPPINIISGNNKKITGNIDFAGFTCIESDYLYRGYVGDISKGDYVIFSNVGSYSIVLKPPFILPNYSVIDVSNIDNIELIKEKELFEDVFKTYIWN